ncbi:MAG: hypothetical protein PHE20_01665 [Patescibacteria group bacterium]|nr:hypothetical protein [Patescibacteria group bacterium]
MPPKKKTELFFSKEQRQLIWTMLVLLIIAGALLFIFSWQLTRLKYLPDLVKEQTLSYLFQGELLAEQNLATLPASDSFDELSFLASPNGRRFAYILNNNESQQLVLDEKADPIFSSITFMTFSPDSNNFAYLAKRDNREVAVINGQVGREYDWIFSPHLFSLDSQYFIYKARRDGKEFMVVNENESRAYDRIYDIMLSPVLGVDIRHFIYKAQRDGKEFIVVNENESRAYDSIYDLMLSPDNSSLFFFAREGEHLWRGEIPLTEID